MNARVFVAVVVFACVMLWAGDVLACPACVDPRAETNNAIFRSTIALSIVPLMFIGAIVHWVVKRERQRRIADERGVGAETHEAAPIFTEIP